MKNYLKRAAVYANRPIRTAPALFVIGLSAALAVGSVGQAVAATSAPYWEKNGSAVFYDDGNVGIGTSAPIAELHIKQGNAGYSQSQVYGGSGLFIENSGASVLQLGSNPNDWTAIFFGDRDAYAAGQILYHNTDNRMAFYSSGKERMRLTGDGNLGIRTESPLADLHIKQGDAGFAQGSVYANAGLFIENSSSSVIQLGSSPNDWAAVFFGDKDMFGAGQVLYHNSDNRMAFYTNNSEKMRILANGNVGVGTGVPAEKLDVAGNIKAHNLKFTSEGSIFNTDEIIGYNDLRLYGDSNGGPDLTLSANGTLTLANDADILGGDLIQGYNDLRLSAAVGNGTDVYIGTNGNVGIGTTNPGSYRLAVEGKLGAREIVVTSANWADYVFEEGYNLLPLSEVKAHIEAHGYLPNMPSALEIEQSGANVGDTQAKLLEKIEELTLYTIEQEEKINLLTERLEKLEQSH